MIRLVLSSPDVSAALDDAPRLVAAAAGDLVTRAARNAYREALRRAPGPRAASGVLYQEQGTGYAKVARVYLAGVSIPIAKGAGPHEIAASEGHVLRLASGAFATRVAHPGMQGFHFLRDGAAATVAALDPDLRQTGDAVVAQIAAEVHP